MNEKVGDTKGIREVRCSNCGKLLFKIYKKDKKTVYNPSQSVIIVSRCNRCRFDNRITL